MKRKITKNMMLQCWAFYLTRGLGWMLFTIFIYPFGLNIIHLGICLFILEILLIPIEIQKNKQRSVLGMFLCMIFEQLLICFGLFYITMSIPHVIVMLCVVVIDVIVFGVIYKRKPSKSKHKKT